MGAAAARADFTEPFRPATMDILPATLSVFAIHCRRAHADADERIRRSLKVCTSWTRRQAMIADRRGEGMPAQAFIGKTDLLLLVERVSEPEKILL